MKGDPLQSRKKRSREERFSCSWRTPKKDAPNDIRNNFHFHRLRKNLIPSFRHDICIHFFLLPSGGWDHDFFCEFFYFFSFYFFVNFFSLHFFRLAHRTAILARCYSMRRRGKAARLGHRPAGESVRKAGPFLGQPGNLIAVFEHHLFADDLEGDGLRD